MKKSEYELTKQWVETWKQAAQALEQVKKSELKNFDYQKNWEKFDEILAWTCTHAQRRMKTGLMEMQNYFMKLR